MTSLLEEPTSLNLSWNVTPCGPSDNFKRWELIVPTFTLGHDPVYSGRYLPTFRGHWYPKLLFYSEAVDIYVKVTRFLPDYTALHRRRWNFACTLLTFCVFGIHAASQDTFVSVAQWGWFQQRTYLIATLRGVRRDSTRVFTVTNFFQPQIKGGSRLLGWQ